MSRARSRATPRAEGAIAGARGDVAVAGARAKLAELDASLLDIVDHVLTKGIVLTGDLVLGVADIDLVYLRLSAVLCAADRVLGPSAKRRRATAHGVAQKMGRPRLTPKPR